MTPEQQAKVHSAMEEAGGDFSHAAKLLGLKPVKLKELCKQNNELREKWTMRAVQPVNVEAVQIHRPSLPAVKDAAEALLSEAEIAKAIEAEDCLVRKGLDNTGMRVEVRDLAMALQKLHSKHFTRCVEMLGGGITKQFLDVMAEVQELSRRLNDLDNPPTPEQEMLWREDRSRLLDMMQKFYDRANAATLTQAKVKLMKEQAGSNRRGGKPGFSPLVAVQINEAEKRDRE